MNGRNCLQHTPGHIAGQGYIVLGRGELLSFGQDPSQELRDRLSLCGVLNLLGHQEPGETRDRIRILVLRVETLWRARTARPSDPGGVAGPTGRKRFGGPRWALMVEVRNVERQIRFISDQIAEFAIQNADFFRAVHSLDFELENIRPRRIVSFQATSKLPAGQPASEGWR